MSLPAHAQTLYVSNFNNNTIEAFNTSGVGTQFNVSGDVDGPEGLAFDSAGNLYVVNQGDDTIEKFNSSGMGTQFNVSGTLDQPYGLAIDSADNLYVANYGNSTIEKFNSLGVGTQFNVSGDVIGPAWLAFAPAASSVPEPGSVALLIGLGLTGLSLLARRRRHRGTVTR